ncbi:hypothetical protein [Streptomyces sp. NPDC050164]|uniref:hypothetical protein n=1 Tax=Streptomyces sp. NPDC050164 TaxID=3365605 RepID=UPI0037B39BF7
MLSLSWPDGGWKRLSEDLLRQLPQDTSLRRAYVTHLQSGRHWHARTGWIAY